MSKYVTIAQELIVQINNNIQKGITKLATEEELCQRYQVSRQTVRSALELLVSRGLIEKRQGSGTYATGLSLREEDNQIPVLLYDSDKYLYPSFVSEISEQLNTAGFTIKIYETMNNTNTERSHLLTHLQNPPRAMIVEGCKSALPNPNICLYEELKEKGTSLLFVHNYYRELKDVPYVKDDNYYGGYLLTEYLWNLGHRNIACLFKIDDLQGVERYSGCNAFLRTKDSCLADCHVKWYTSEDYERMQTRYDYGFIKDFIKYRLTDCTAVICYNDEIAYRLIKELRLIGLSVPQQISVVSFDNSYLSEMDSIHITTLSHSQDKISNQVVSCVLQLMKGQTIVSKELPWQLIKKGSAGPCDILSENSPVFS